MKKITFLIAFLFVFTMGTFAQGGGLFQYGSISRQNDWNTSSSWNSGFGGRDAFNIGLIGFSHGLTTDTDPDPSPLGSGALLLIGFGAAYALKKGTKKETR